MYKNMRITFFFQEVFNEKAIKLNDRIKGVIVFEESMGVLKGE